MEVRRKRGDWMGEFELIATCVFFFEGGGPTKGERDRMSSLRLGRGVGSQRNAESLRTEVWQGRGWRVSFARSKLQKLEVGDGGSCFFRKKAGNQWRGEDAEYFRRGSRRTGIPTGGDIAPQPSKPKGVRCEVRKRSGVVGGRGKGGKRG